MTLDHLSYSSISAYLTCARAWRFKYVESIPTFSTPELVFGSAIHNAIETYVQSDRQAAPVDCWKQSWDKALERDQQVVWGADTPESHFNEGVRILTDEKIVYNLNTITPAYDEQGAKVERKVELRVPGVPIPVIGYIDIITHDGVPCDFKTSSKSWSSDRAIGETQSLFYLAALNQAGQTVPGWKFRHLVIVKTKTPQFQMFEHSHRPSECFWLFGMIQNVWKGIDAGVFPENPTGWKCSPQYCDFWMRCRGK